MLIKKRPSWFLPYSDVTPEPVYTNRRAFMARTLAAAAGIAMPGILSAGELLVQGEPLAFTKMPGFSTTWAPIQGRK